MSAPDSASLLSIRPDLRVLRHRAITRLISYRENINNGQPEYQVQWESNKMKLDELCIHFNGEPLLSQVLELHLCRESSGVRHPSEFYYVVQWKPTWVEIGELVHSSYLLHEFWIRECKRWVAYWIYCERLK
jgi:hypothetical protein